MVALKRIFISRELEANSPFLAVLGKQAIVEGQSLIEFEGLLIPSLPNCEWLFFYSKNGLQFAWEALRGLSPWPKIAVLGQASAEYLAANFDYQADFVGTGAPESTAATFLEVAAGQQVCFIQARKSRQSVARLLGKQVQTQNLAVYDNRPKTILDLPVYDVLVFTSPLNAQAYYQQYSPLAAQKIIAIGQTTARALQVLGVQPNKIASTPHERSLAHCCLPFL